MAETVNYVIQRGDIYSTLGVVAALVTFAYCRGSDRAGIICATRGGPAEQAARAGFPAILFVYIRLLKTRNLPARGQVCPAHWWPPCSGYGERDDARFIQCGRVSGCRYRITQGWWRAIFREVFVPPDLTADTDHVALASAFDDGGGSDSYS